MKRAKHRNPHIGRDALGDVRARTKGNPKLRARIDAAVARVAIGVMVKRARTLTGLTQAQLAARARTTQAVIARIEGGKAFTASLDLLDRIARALGGRLSVEFEGIHRDLRQEPRRVERQMRHHPPCNSGNGRSQ